ncbi:scavenger receptor class F member 1-like [Haliotis rubra]|uniref:scavenger receptor class F member 1-like n=1 Tax=Haliotis rubra TaxID=36100 RepID=UPI001EE5FC65|nr:scavenger receptor class F member 1-like [Haliotis rubra]
MNNHCLNTSCSQTSGECEYGCVLGWYRPTCSTRCPDNCAAGACNRYDGSCLSCRERFRDTYCNMSCPRHCVECDQNASNCMSCEPGYFVNTCGEKCNGCPNEKCEITDGFCIDGCKPNLFGRECQSCHCLMPRCNVTGLCTGCQNGYYGQRCSSTCPPRCDTCEQYTGDCVTCVEGWRGHMCNVSYVRSVRQLVRVLSSCIGVVLFSAVIVAAFIIIRKKCTGSPRGIYLSPVRTDHLVSDDISLQEFSDNGESEQSQYETIPDNSQAGYEALSPSTSRTSGYTALLQSAENARVTAD